MILPKYAISGSLKGNKILKPLGRKDDVESQWRGLGRAFETFRPEYHNVGWIQMTTRTTVRYARSFLSRRTGWTPAMRGMISCRHKEAPVNKGHSYCRRVRYTCRRVLCTDGRIQRITWDESMLPHDQPCNLQDHSSPEGKGERL